MLGVCYYPEHWPEAKWAEDADRMADLGLRFVRIGEFAWSRLEPGPGRYDFAWLDRAIAVLGNAGLGVVLGTPTATPPKWLVDRHPDILPVDPLTGRVRGFGSRRHTDFSSVTWLREALRITTALAERYGGNEHVVGWQTDNELCCHDTALSASPAARDGFRRWCRDRYGDIATLNQSWGNVFWSLEYRDFDEIDLPVGAVTETSPAHRLAWRRYASDAVATWHDAMVAAIRRHAPGRFVTHNFIPMHETGVDNRRLAAGLDFAAYDNYPLGRTDLVMAAASAETFRPWMRTGHPDLAALQFDQTRALAPGAFWIMEQQPGPVNWAPHNPRPAPGMVRLWTWEAFAHGAAVVSYFRWRQAPFAQEQMHAGLLRPDSSPAEAWAEVTQVAAELALHPLPATAPSRVALLIDIEAQWLSAIERQGAGYDYTAIVHQWYGAVRRLGVDVDCVAPGDDLSGYALVLVPALAMPDARALAPLRATAAAVVFGPRSGAKTKDATIPDGLPPGALRELVPVRLLSVETLRADCPETISYGNHSYASVAWREAIDAGDCDVLARYADGSAALVRRERYHYLATLTDDALLDALFAALFADVGVAVTPLPTAVRLRRRGPWTFALNYGDTAVVTPAPAGARFLLGGATIGAHDLAIWSEPV